MFNQPQMSYRILFSIIKKSWPAGINYSYQKRNHTMKKILVVAALILSTGIISSCSKTNDVQPASNQARIMVANDKKNLATGD